MPGSKSVADKLTVCVGTWESQNVPRKPKKSRAKVMRRYVVLAVGLTHSRGVNRVMPNENNKFTRRG